MPRRKTTKDSNKLKQGRGQGHGESYKPFLTVRDVPSQGLCHRIKGYKTNRTHHFLSNLERDYFHILEWSPIVVDIREQYPLELAETLSISERLGIRHPADPKTKEPVIMTTDFLIDFLVEGGRSQKARSIKMSSDLSSGRTIEKQEIERTYWTERKIDWGIVTELDIPRTLTKNIQWIHNAMVPGGGPDMSPQMMVQAEIALFDQMQDSRMSMAEAASAVDALLGLKPGTGLFLVRYLIATRQWIVDLAAPIPPDQPLRFSRNDTTQEGIA